ncbi:hypothetical protein PG984_015053 [Apiospora sp. TS-2023a]
MPVSRKRLAPTAGQVNDIKLVRTSVLCNGDLATYPPQGRRGNNSAALTGKSHIPSASRALSRRQHYAHRLPENLSSKIEDELYALNLLQLTRDYPLSPYCLRYPLDFLLESLPDKVRCRVVVLLDPSTTPELEGKLFGEDEEAFEEAMEYLEHDRQEEQQGLPQRQPKLRGGKNDDDDDDDEDDEDEDEEEEEDEEDVGEEDTESEFEFDHFDHYPEFLRDIRRHGEYVFWPVDAGGHQWLLCVLHLKRTWSHGPYEQVTDFAVVDPEWSGDGSGDADSLSIQSRERVRRVTKRLVQIFKAGGIEINPSNTQRQIWVAPSTVLPPAAAALPLDGDGDDGDGANQQRSSPRWESGVRCFQLVRELLGRATSYACPGAPGFEDERFFEPGAGWVDVDAVRHEMVGMALQRCNAALGYACRYYLAPIDTLALIGGDGDGDGDGNGDDIRRIVQPDSLRPSRVGKVMHAPGTLDLLNDGWFDGDHNGVGGAGRKRSGGGVVGGVLKAISHNAGNILGESAAADLAVEEEEGREPAACQR